MPKRSRSAVAELPINNTVKLTDPLRLRVIKAMEVGGFSVWSEFCRVALTEKCLATERELREHHPAEFARLYGTAAGRRESAGVDGARVNLRG